MAKKLKAVAKKKPRTIEEIRQEATNIRHNIGEITYAHTTISASCKRLDELEAEGRQSIAYYEEKKHVQ